MHHWAIFLAAGSAIVYGFEGAVNLLLPQSALVQCVLFRVGDDETLLEIVLVYPPFLIKHFVADLCGLVSEERHGIVLSADVPPIGA